MASECFHPVGQPSEARSLAGVGTADAVVGDLDDEQAVVPGEVDLARLAEAYLATLVSDSETT